MKKIKIGILDDHLLFSEAISDILKSQSIYEVSFVTNSVEIAIKQVEENELDLIVLDLNIPPYNGLDLIEDFKKIYPKMKTLILTMHQPCDINLDLETFNGDGYMLKTSGKSILIDAVTKVLTGEKFIDADVLKISNKPTLTTNNLKLSKRELEISKLIVEGKTTKQISSELFISELTVKTHRKNIAEKLDSEGVTDFVNKVTKIIKNTLPNSFTFIS